MDTFNCQRAESEGWSFFVNHGEGPPQLQLQRTDDADIFSSDADAWDFVWDKAQAGSEYHQQALEYLQANNPEEFRDLVNYCTQE